MLTWLLVVLSQAEPAAAPPPAPCERAAWLRSLSEEPSLRAEVPSVGERRVPWQETHKHLCGAVSTSDDGKVRLWVPLYEKLDEEDGVQPGEAHLQWLDEKGRVHAKQLDPSLHLDNVVDRIVALDKGRYLILGLRSCFTTYAGGCPRRYARVIQLDASDMVTPVALVLLQGQNPSTDKFRHHVLASNWLAWKDGKVWIEKFPGYDFGPEVKRAELLKVRDGRLVFAGKLPGGLSVARGW